MHSNTESATERAQNQAEKRAPAGKHDHAFFKRCIQGLSKWVYL